MAVKFTLAEETPGIVVRRSWSNDAWHRQDLSCVVAVPARNEASRVGRCLEGLARQEGAKPFGVLVLINGTTDTTFSKVVAHGRNEGLPMMAVEADLPIERCNAGAARCIAVQMAIRRIATKEGSVFITDADSIAPRRWIAEYSVMLDASYDAVAGQSRLLSDDMQDIPRSLLQRGLLEERYETCLDALETWLDPVPHDPWPRHYQASGANLALRVGALHKIGNEPWPACGEDASLVRSLQAKDCRVRHDTAHQVMTSGRLFGRARGGKADTMRKRILEPDSACDERLEALDRAYFRARTRRLCRELHASGYWAEHMVMLAERVRLPRTMLREAFAHRGFGATWQAIEMASPPLRRSPLRPSQLSAECARGEALLAQWNIPFMQGNDASTAGLL
jgi:hypothetical protein